MPHVIHLDDLRTLLLQVRVPAGAVHRYDGMRGDEGAARAFALRELVAAGLTDSDLLRAIAHRGREPVATAPERARRRWWPAVRRALGAAVPPAPRR